VTRPRHQQAVANVAVHAKGFFRSRLTGTVAETSEAGGARTTGAGQVPSDYL